MNVTVTPNAVDDRRIIISNVRIAYADGLNIARVPRTNTPNPNAKPQYSSVVFIPKSETGAIEAIRKAMISAVKQKFNAQAEAKWKMITANNKLPLKDGDLKFDKNGEPMDGYAGNYFISVNAKEDRPPTLLDIIEETPGSGKPLRLTRPQNRIYSGCYVNVDISMWGYSTGADGVGSDLLVVQFAADGDRFGSSAGEPDISAFRAIPAPKASISNTSQTADNFNF